MNRRWTTQVANFFVIAYALDAGLSLVEEMLRTAIGSEMLLGPRNALAQIVLVLGLLYLPLLVLIPRLPTLALFGLITSLVWFFFGGVPLPWLFESEAALGVAYVILQAGFASLAFLSILRRNAAAGASSWLWTDAALQGPPWSIKHSAVALAGVLVVLVPVLAISGVLIGMSAIEHNTKGFVRFDFEGVSLADRHYRRDDNEIRLVGMMHIGESDNYRRLVQTFAQESTVVMAEGVTDIDFIMQTPLSYDNVASALGLEQQANLSDYLDQEPGGDAAEWPVIRHADLDMGDFTPETREFLDRISVVMNSDEMIAAMQEVIDDYEGRQNVFETIERDIFERRNEHLLEEMKQALTEFDRVIVPWGALHLPDIEQRILEANFKPFESTHHRLISWHSIATALLTAF